MPNQFKNVFLQPGRYQVGGRVVEFDAKQLKNFAKNTNAMIHAGLNVPIFAQHTKPSDPRGGPSYDKNDSRNCVGNVSEIKVNSDGSLSNRLNITDRDARQRVTDGSVKFTSPEIVKNFTDGKNRNWGQCFRHFALTPTPRNPDQTALEPVEAIAMSEALDDGPLQFSLGDLVQFHDHGGTKDNPQESPGNDPSPVEVTEENPDVTEPKSSDKKAQAIVVLLGQLGVELPSDFDFSTGLDSLLAGLKTLVAANRKAENKEADMQQPSGEESPITMEPGNMSTQFTEEHKALIDKNTELIAQLSEANRSKLVDSVTAAKLPPAMAKALTDRIETVQFAEDGTDEPAMSISQVIALFDESVPQNVRGLDSAAIEDPPPGYATANPDENSDQSAEDIYRKSYGTKWTPKQNVRPVEENNVDFSGNQTFQQDKPVDDPRKTRRRKAAAVA